MSQSSTSVELSSERQDDAAGTSLRVSPSATAHRLLWVDVARGIGINLVVFAHAIRGLAPVRGAAPDWAVWQDHIIYKFHMPLFFVLAGLFLWPSLQRGRKAFLKDRSLTVLYPYVVWSLLIGVMEILASSYVNSPVRSADLVAIPWQPIEQFWFLYALFTLQIVAFLTFPRRILLIAAGVLLPMLPAILPQSPYIVVTFIWLPFLVLGHLLAPAFNRFAQMSRGRIAILAGAGWLVFALLEVSASSLSVTASFYAAGAVGAVATIFSAMLLRNGGFASALAWLGAASMAIFVMHSAASAGARTIVRLFWSAAPFELLLLLTFAVGMIVPALVYWQAQRLGALQLLGLGRDKPRQRTAPAETVPA